MGRLNVDKGDERSEERRRSSIRSSLRLSPNRLKAGSPAIQHYLVRSFLRPQGAETGLSGPRRARKMLSYTTPVQDETGRNGTGRTGRTERTGRDRTDAWGRLNRQQGPLGQ